MFGISFEELLVILVLAFLLFGPQKLPEYAATLGRFVAMVRQAGSEVTRQCQTPFQSSPEAPSAPAPTFTCPECLGKVAAEFIFCPQCGHRLQKEHYPPPPRPPEPVRQAEPPPAPEPVKVAYPRIRPLNNEEIDRALAIINQAALAYKGVIPADCWHETYMPEADLRAEIAAGVQFWGYESEAGLVGVMGRQDLHDVTLIRHAYVDPAAQRQGLGARLLASLLEEILNPVLVGTWAAAWWAIRFYEKHGFRLVTQAEKDRLLNTYWTISPRQVETSVVLADERWFALLGHAA